MSAGRRWARAGLALVVAVLAVPLGAVAAAGAARPSPVFVSTVPAMAGVHLEVAGIYVVTGADGTAAVGVIDTAGVSHDVHVTDHRAAGGHKVWLSKVSRSGDTSSGVRLQVGLNVASAVRLRIDPAGPASRRRRCGSSGCTRWWARRSTSIHAARARCSCSRAAPG